MLRDDYQVSSIGTDDFIEKKTPVQILTIDAHRLDETAFHKRLNAWNKNVLSDRKLDSIINNPHYDQPYKVVDEYIKFLNEYPEYRDVIPVVRAFAKTHGIPITQ